METKYVYLGKNINLPEFSFGKGGVYYGDKIEELKEKYSLLSKLLIPIEELSNYNVNDVYLETISNKLIEIIEGGN